MLEKRESIVSVTSSSCSELLDMLRNRLKQSISKTGAAPESQHNYNTIEKEALALLITLQHFEVYLGGSMSPLQFTPIITLWCFF